MSYLQNTQYNPQIIPRGTNITFNRGVNIETIPSQPVQVTYQQPTTVITPVVTSNFVPITNVVTTTQPQKTSNVIITSQRVNVIEKEPQVVVVKNQNRFANYNTNDYKYNLFSLIDQPINRCVQVGKCGTCPGNQCIARQIRRKVLHN